jgi:L-2-hydroxyglutarate oxidase LhgO
MKSTLLARKFVINCIGHYALYISNWALEERVRYD